MPSQPLRPEDILVEFRDKQLTRQGSIPLDDLQLKMQPVVNGVGSWSLTLPAEHRAVPYLRAPGSGILVTNLRTGETLLSGPTSKPSKRATSADPVGMATLSGLTDDRLLWDALAFPNPAISDPLASSQSQSNDIRTSTGEGLMRQYVAYNIANGAIALPAPVGWAPAGRLGGFRNFLRLEAVNKNLGTNTTRRPRFDILGDLLVGIASEQGLAFRLVQVGSFLEFQVYQPSDRTAEIRLDVNNGTLQEQNVEFAPPEVTRMVVAGQGEGTERQFISMTSADATTAEAAWGLIIEEWKDQRQTGVVSELEAAALERLNEAGFTKVAVKATPANETTMIFMEDFFLGDKVSVVIDGQEQPNSHITEAAIIVNSDGIQTAVAIGDIMDFDSDSALRQTVSDTQRRVDNLERNAEATTPPGNASTTQQGIVRLATNAETQAGTNATIAVTPAGLASRTATATRTGVVELATDAETQTGTDTARAVTPANLSARTATDVRTGIVELATNAEATTGTDTVRAVTPAALKAAMLALIYPVGSIFMSTVNTSPAASLGGTWVAWGSGQVPVGVDTGQTEFNTVEKTGGAKTHTLQATEMPSHTHRVGAYTSGTEAGGYGLVGGGGFGDRPWVATAAAARLSTEAAGGGGAHNNLQPYITCYMWKRTA